MATSPRFQAVLFDYDGTLADSFAAITASVNHVLRHFDRPSLTEEHVRGLVGHGLEQLMRAVLPDIDPAHAANLYREHHPSVMESHTRILPGVEEGLPRLQAAGVRMGVCSNKPSPFTRELLRMFGMDRFFGTVFGPDDAGAAKPDPAMLLKSLEILGVPRENALYVGDMQVDIETGRNAGIETWAVPTGSHSAEFLRSARPQRLYPGIGQIVAEILGPEVEPKSQQRK